MLGECAMTQHLQDRGAWGTVSLMGMVPVSSFSTWAAGPPGCSPSPVCTALPFLMPIQVSPLFSFHCKLQQKSQHATDSLHGVQGTFLRRSAFRESFCVDGSDPVHFLPW